VPPKSEPRLVRELMTVGVQTCTTATPIVDIVRLILQQNIEALVVLDEQGHAVGIVSQDELVSAYSRDDCRELVADDLMRPDIPQIPPEVPLGVAAQIMLDRGVRALFLMHNAGGIGYPAAVLTYSHILRHLGASDSDDLSELGIHADRHLPLGSFFQKRDEARQRANPRKE